MTAVEFRDEDGDGREWVYWNDERIGPFYTGTMQFLRVMIGFICFVLSTVVIFLPSES